MTESEALDVTAMRVIETEDCDRSVWTDADRAWASHEAAATLGEKAAADMFLARRARYALNRLSGRMAPLHKALRALAWRPWVGTVIVVAAFAAGVLADRIGNSQRINVLAPPVLLLLVWNILVYLFTLTAPLWRGLLQRATDPLVGLVSYLGTGLHPGRSRLGAPGTHWFGAVASEWSRTAAPLYRVRAVRILHLAAAALALGVIAGLYLRGLTFEYRATWESTFLDASAVHAVLSIVLAPGSWLGGPPVADLAGIEAMRAPGSVNAASWLHLIALTLLAMVVVPRMLLAFVASWREGRQMRRLPLQLELPYFRRLLRGFHVDPNPVQVVPYGFTPTTAAMAGLDALLARLVGGSAAVRVAAAAAYGDDDDRSLAQLSDAPGPVVVVFNLAATPEREAHGAFAAAAAARASKAQPLLVVVDETSFKARSVDDPQRIVQRRIAWRELLQPTRVEPVFIDLSAPDAATADAAMDAALFVPAA
jgi:hypothetical protein